MRHKSRGAAVSRFLLVILIGNLVWETLQMPLYTLWFDGTWGQIGYALVHCTLGDVLIGAATLMAALLVLRAAAWPDTPRGQVMVVTVGPGTGLDGVQRMVECRGVAGLGLS